MEGVKIYGQAIDRSQLQALSTLSSFRSMFAIIGEWLLIGGSILLYHFYPYPLLYLLAYIIIGTRMYALYSLLHDGIHYLLIRNRPVNDWICRILLAWPLFIDLDRMRRAHLAHHRELQTPDDPELVHLRYEEFQFPRPAGAIFVTFLLDISGINYLRYRFSNLINFIKQAPSSKKAATEKEMPVRLLYYTVILSVLIYMGWVTAFLLFWIVPYITIYQILNRLRLSTEHFHLGDENKYQTRTVKLNRLERFFLSPHNLGFHTEHHIYPSVPFYSLPALHQLLMYNEEYQKHAVIEESYAKVIKKYIN